MFDAHGLHTQACAIREFLLQFKIEVIRVSVQGVKSLGGNFVCLCRGIDFYEVKKIIITL